MSEWIAARHRPPEGQAVWVWPAEEKAEFYYRHKTRHGDWNKSGYYKGGDLAYGRPLANVTHWQPLPAPPAE